MQQVFSSDHAGCDSLRGKGDKEVGPILTHFNVLSSALYLHGIMHFLNVLLEFSKRYCGLYNA